MRVNNNKISQSKQKFVADAGLWAKCQAWKEPHLRLRIKKSMFSLSHLPPPVLTLRAVYTGVLRDSAFLHYAQFPPILRAHMHTEIAHLNASVEWNCWTTGSPYPIYFSSTSQLLVVHLESILWVFYSTHEWIFIMYTMASFSWRFLGTVSYIILYKCMTMQLNAFDDSIIK